jgi:hypothetical protein
MNKRAGIRALVLLVMMASMVISSGCINEMSLLLCGDLAYWDYNKFGCHEMDPAQMEANLEKYTRESNQCIKNGGEWIHSTLTCSYATRDKKDAHDKCVKESGEWIPGTNTCSYTAKNKKDAYDKCEKAGGEWIPWTNACSVPVKNKEETKAHKCEEEGGEWVTWTNSCSIPTKNKEKAAANAAGDNAAATPGKLPDKSDTK